MHRMSLEFEYLSKFKFILKNIINLQFKDHVYFFNLGSSGGSLVATPDYEAAVLGSNLAISPAYSRLPVHR